MNHKSCKTDGVKLSGNVFTSVFSNLLSKLKK